MAKKDKHDLHEHDAPIRDDLSGEDLSRGPTPETRHPAGHVTGRDFGVFDLEVVPHHAHIEVEAAP